MKRDDVPVDRHALLALLDETFDVIEWLASLQPDEHPEDIDFISLNAAHRQVLSAFEGWTVEQIEKDLSGHDNVTSIFTKLQFFRE